jgi:hypothetical protein
MTGTGIFAVALSNSCMQREISRSALALWEEYGDNKSRGSASRRSFLLHAPDKHFKR